MILSEEERKNLIKYKLERSKATIEEAKLLIENNKLYSAVNRIYYANFYSVSALALIYNFSTSKHKQLIGWFNRTFIKTGTLPEKFGAILSRSFDKRTKGDYGDFVEFKKEEVEKMFDEMKEFVSEIERLILQ